MMDTRQLLLTFPFMLSAQVGLVCILLLLKHLKNNQSLMGHKPILIAVAAYASSALGMASVALYITMPVLYAGIGVPIMLCFVTVNILYYRFIFELTRTQEDERFSLWHYVAPGTIVLVYLVWSLQVPFEVQCQVAASKSDMVEGYRAYSWFSSSKPMFFSLFMTVYGIITVFRTRRFRRVVVNYSADEERASLWWLWHIIYTTLGMAPLALAFILLSNRTLTSTLIIIVPIAFFIFRDVMLVHHILIDNYVVITPEPASAWATDNRPLTPREEREGIRRLEEYMCQTKPYLRPKLKITDMVADLNTNRTSLSLLINRKYGMNFSRFINRYRLEELQHIKTDPANASLSELEMIAKAGFSDWRGYLRVKEREEVYNG